MAHPLFLIKCCGDCPLRLVEKPAEPKLTVVHDLTKKEFEVAKALAEGLSNREICARMVLSNNTVKYHITNIIRKLPAVTNRTGVAIWVVKNDLA